MALVFLCFLFFFNDPATTEIYTLSLHDALPILSDLFAATPRGGSNGTVLTAFAMPKLSDRRSPCPGRPIPTQPNGPPGSEPHRGVSRRYTTSKELTQVGGVQLIRLASRALTSLDCHRTSRAGTGASRAWDLPKTTSAFCWKRRHATGYRSPVLRPWAARSFSLVRTRSAGSCSRSVTACLRPSAPISCIAIGVSLSRSSRIWEPRRCGLSTFPTMKEQPTFTISTRE